MISVLKFRLIRPTLSIEIIGIRNPLDLELTISLKTKNQPDFEGDSIFMSGHKKKKEKKQSLKSTFISILFMILFTFILYFSTRSLLLLKAFEFKNHYGLKTRT